MERIGKNLLQTVDESREMFASLNDQTRELQDISNKVVALVERLKKERENLGLSQRDFASLLGWKQPALARFGSLDAIPRLDTFIKVSNRLGANIYIEFFDSNIVPVQCMKSAK